jgi:serine protease Do
LVSTQGGLNTTPLGSGALKAILWLGLVLPAATAFGQLDSLSSRTGAYGHVSPPARTLIVQPPAPSRSIATSTGKPHPAVARIVARERGSISMGSGTLVAVEGNRGLVVSNWHVVRDASGTVEVHFPNGFQSTGHVLKTDEQWDLAAILIERPSIDPVPISDVMPQRGDALTIAGYGSGPYRAVTGRCTQFLSPGKNAPFEMIELSVAARQGDSGGPILNSRGELAGVLFGATRSSTSGSYGGRVRQFLDGVTLGASTLGDEMLASTPSPSQRPTRLPRINQIPSASGAWVAAPKSPTHPSASAPAVPVDSTESSDELVEQVETLAPDVEQIAEVDDPPQADPPAREDEQLVPRYTPLPIAPVKSVAGDARPAAPAAVAIGLPRPIAAAPTGSGTYAAVTAAGDAQSPGALPPRAADPIVDDAALLTWEDLAGHSLLEQAKTAFAVLGALGLALHSLRWFKVL